MLMTKKHQMQRLIMWVGAVILLIVIAVLMLTKNKKIEVIQPVVSCTQEAKLCPDGSYVGRVGPQCQFADCPTGGTVAQDNTTQAPVQEIETNLAMINQKILNNSIHINPTEVVEDSRCPTDLNCMWKGVIRIKVKLDNGKVSQVSELSLGNTVVFSEKRISLIDVTPSPNSTRTILPGDYRFKFKVVGISTSSTGSLVGTMTIGPICPVERISNPCLPTPEMFKERALNVYKLDKTTLVATMVPDARGKFSAKLPAGSYYVDMANFVGKPATASGVPTIVNISENSTETIVVTIDTGIR